MSAEPLTTFSSEDVIGNAWPRTLVTYPLSFQPGQARPDRLKLVNANGVEAVYQISRLKLHPDGSIATTLISFMAELPKNGAYQFELLPEPAAAGERVITPREREMNE